MSSASLSSRIVIRKDLVYDMSEVIETAEARRKQMLLPVR